MKFLGRNISHNVILITTILVLMLCCIAVKCSSDDNNIYTTSSVSLFNKSLKNKDLQMLYATVKPKKIPSGFTRESAEVYVVVWPTLLFIKRMYIVTINCCSIIINITHKLMRDCIPFQPYLETLSLSLL
jgi:hypothetical protein